MCVLNGPITVHCTVYIQYSVQGRWSLENIHFQEKTRAIYSIIYL